MSIKTKHLEIISNLNTLEVIRFILIEFRKNVNSYCVINEQDDMTIIEAIEYLSCPPFVGNINWHITFDKINDDCILIY